MMKLLLPAAFATAIGLAVAPAFAAPTINNPGAVKGIAGGIMTAHEAGAAQAMENFHANVVNGPLNEANQGGVTIACTECDDHH